MKSNQKKKAPEVQSGPQNKPELTVFSTPQQRFMGIPANKSAHQNMVDAPAFDRGADAALCEYVRALVGTVQSSESAMAAGYKLQGAVRFLAQFKTLAEIQKAPEKQPNPDVLRPSEPPRRP